MNSHHLRSIFRRIFVAVREGANGLKEVWGPEARQMPGYREALIDIAVTLNAAQSAYDLRLEVERAGKWEIEVLYSVFDTRTHRVSMPADPATPSESEPIHLAYAPTNPRDFTTLAVQIARSILSAQSQQPRANVQAKDGSASNAMPGLPEPQDEH